MVHWWGQGRCHGVGAGALVSKGEGPDNQQEVEGGRGEWGGDKHVMECGGGG
jgi:hypothetical protein